MSKPSEVKFTIKIGRKVEGNIRKILNDALQKDEVLLNVGLIARQGIVASIVKAQEPSTGKKFQNPTITEDWRKRKKVLSATGSNKPFDGASGGGSKNARLIFTGTFLKSITHSIGKSATRKVIEIQPEGDHPPYVGVRGKALGPLISNKTLGKYLREQGRDWLGFPETTRPRLITAVRNFLRRELTRRNKG